MGPAVALASTLVAIQRIEAAADSAINTHNAQAHVISVSLCRGCQPLAHTSAQAQRGDMSRS